jgi:hypothetical protein
MHTKPARREVKIRIVPPAFTMNSIIPEREQKSEQKRTRKFVGIR